MLLKLIKQSIISIIGLSVLTPALAADDATDTLVNIDLSSGLLSEIQEALPESTVVNQSFLNPSYNPNIQLQNDAHIGITFLDEGAGYRNSLGYFTFSDDSFNGYSFGDIDTDNSGHIGISELSSLTSVNTGMVFNNASKAGAGGSLQAGDTVTLGGATITNIQGTDFDMEGGETFTEGTNVGFFLLQNAWDGSQVKGWDYDVPDPLAFYSVDFLNPENNPYATLGNADEDARHVAMMTTSADNEVILGFEDLVRPGGDNDFNDAVFRIRTDPVSALFAQVPSTEEVISLQAAPMTDLGKSYLTALIFMLGILIVLLRETKKVSTQYC